MPPHAAERLVIVPPSNGERMLPESTRLEMACGEIERSVATVQRIVTSLRYSVTLIQEALDGPGRR